VTSTLSVHGGCPQSTPTTLLSRETAQQLQTQPGIPGNHPAYPAAMDRDGGGDDGAPQASQASSHFPLDPVPASVLAAGELARRNAARALGPCSVGCAEVDDEALLGAGGLERGSVVGVSCEDEDGFGLTVCLSLFVSRL